MSLLASFVPLSSEPSSRSMETSHIEAAQGWALAKYASIVRRTARLDVDSLERMEEAWATGRPVILTAWHGMTMMIAAFVGNYADLTRYVVIVPNDTRGATLSIWAQSMGIDTFPVSMDDISMGGARRMVELMGIMRQGKGLYINPDGPAGPTHEPKSGLAYVARKTGACIVPIGAYAAACYRLSRWDRYTVPLPFARIAVAVREPFEIDPDTDIESASALIRDRLDDAERAAEALYHGRL